MLLEVTELDKVLPEYTRMIIGYATSEQRTFYSFLQLTRDAVWFTEVFRVTLQGWVWLAFVISGLCTL